MSETLLEYICEKWPEISAFLPQETSLAAGRFIGRDNGFCTHPHKVDNYWVHSRGGKRFTMGPTPPDQFFWLGIHDRGGSEYLFLMWYRDRRRFWFYDQYAVFFGQSDASVERTRERLHLALLRWRVLKDDVAFSGPWGWFDVQSNRFEKDPVKGSFPEEWEEPEGSGTGGLDRTIASFREEFDRIRKSEAGPLD